MIPNLLNTVLGIGLAYWAIFFGAGHGYAVPLAAAVVIAILAAWARRNDLSAWQSNVAIALAVALLAFTALRWLGWLSEAGMFWTAFWVGIGVAIVALWSALYRRPSPDAEPV